MQTSLEIKKPNGSEPTALQVSSPTPMDLLQIAITQDVSIEKLAQLMELQQKWESNEARKAFIQAMNDFKKNPPQIVKTKDGPRLGGSNNPPAYKYATLDHVCKEVISGLSQHGIAHRWECEQPETGGVIVTCILTHEMGHSERTTLKAPPDAGPGRNAIQAVASTVTYLQRYTLLAATGLASAQDTDGVPPQDEASTIPDERYVQLRDAILGANNDDELKRAYQLAIQEAKEAKDDTSARDFQKAKNNRYKELHSAGR